MPAATLLRLPDTLRTPDTGRLAETILRANLANRPPPGRLGHLRRSHAPYRRRAAVLWLRHHDACECRR
ncbi:hypothetical protein SUDANB108_07066 [Streptomyces sp. enrichment culture]|uniref:hypothetical protein n=1 Tax=Streptomyces sp. enrichment culture TaxID=1795815 RepID=UPI003F54C32D